MMHCGFSAKGLLKIKWVRKKKTLKAANYLKMVKEHAHDIRSRKRYTKNPFTTRLVDNTEDWWWQQDGATPHTADSTQRWLKDSAPHFIDKVDWPGNSPDLNPIENLWSWVKDKVYAGVGHFNTLDGLKAKVKAVMKTVTVEQLKKLSDSMVTRCKLVREHPERMTGY